MDNYHWAGAYDLKLHQLAVGFIFHMLKAIETLLFTE